MQALMNPAHAILSDFRAGRAISANGPRGTKQAGADADESYDRLIGKLLSDSEHTSRALDRIEGQVSDVRSDVSGLAVSVGKIETGLAADRALTDERHNARKEGETRTRWVISIVVAVVGLAVAVASFLSSQRDIGSPSGTGVLAETARSNQALE